MNNLFVLTIPDGSILYEDYEKETTWYKKIHVEKEFDITDYSFGPHFSRHRQVEEFIVKDENSSFFTSQGCLYKRYIPDDDDNVDHIYAICGELPKDVKSGSILICCP